MSKLDTWIDNKVVQNLFIWFCLFLILLGAVQADNKVVSAIAIIGLLAPAVYVNNIFILPFFNKNLPRFLALFLLNALIFTGVAVFFLVQTLVQDFKWTMFLNFFGILILALTFGSAIRISRDSFVRRQEEKNAQLKLLKAQLNPHFLFNTLNNLYGLSVLKSDKLPELMLKLSNLLRYSLYDTKETYVSLEKELQYLEDYMSLEKIRLEDQTEIAYTRSGVISGKRIAPMLLIVFVENAFKHMGNAQGLKSAVSVAVTIDRDSLIFSCDNSIDKQTTEASLETGKSGIGLQNAQKRLSILYPERHRLAIESKDNEYKVVLTIKL